MTHWKIPGDGTIHAMSTFERQLDRLDRLPYQPNVARYAARSASLDQKFGEDKVLFDVWATFLALVRGVEDAIESWKPRGSTKKRYYDDCVKLHNALTQSFTKQVDARSGVDSGISVQDLYAITIRCGLGGTTGGTPGLHKESPILPLIRAYRDAIRLHAGNLSSYTNTSAGIHHYAFLCDQRTASLLSGERSIIHKPPKRQQEDEPAQQSNAKRSKTRGGFGQAPDPTPGVGLNRITTDEWNKLNDPIIQNHWGTFKDLISAIESGIDICQNDNNETRRSRALHQALTGGLTTGIGFEGPGLYTDELYRRGVQYRFIKVLDRGQPFRWARLVRLWVFILLPQTYGSANPRTTRQQYMTLVCNTLLTVLPR